MGSLAGPVDIWLCGTYPDGPFSELNAAASEPIDMTRTSRTARPFFIWFRPQKRVASCARIPAYQEIIHPPGMGTGRVIGSSVFIDLLFVHGKWS